MKSFTYKIKDETGIHARPAGLLSKLAKTFESEIFIEKGSSRVNASKLMMLMGMGIKCGDTVKVTAQGADEEQAIDELEKYSACSEWVDVCKLPE